MTLGMVAILSASPLSNDKTPFDTPLRSAGEGPTFYMDYASFQGLDSQTYVEFYLQVSYEQLQFIKHKKRFQAAYEIDFTLLDENGNPVENYTNRDAFEVDTYFETQSFQKARVSLMGFTLNSGEYRLRTELTDLETRHASVIATTLQAKNFQSTDLMVSDIQFSQKIVLGENGQPYVKNQRYIEPNAVRNFTHGLSGHFYVYFEIYNLDMKYQAGDQATYSTEFIFSRADGEPVGNLKRDTLKPGPTSAHSLRFALDNFESGDYILRIRIRDNATGQTCETFNSFRVLDIPVSAITEVPMERVSY